MLATFFYGFSKRLLRSSEYYSVCWSHQNEGLVVVPPFNLQSVQEGEPTSTESARTPQ